MTSVNYSSLNFWVLTEFLGTVMELLLDRIELILVLTESLGALIELICTLIE